MAEDHGPLRSIAWRELFPWWLLFRVFRLSISPSILALATAATLLTPLGWLAAENLFLPSDLSSDAELKRLSAELSTWPGSETATNSRRPLETPGFGVPRQVRVPADLLDRPVGRLWDVALLHGRAVYLRFVVPFRRLLTPGQSFSRYAYWLGGCLWTLLVWSLFGGAMTRIAAVRFGPEQRLGVREALRYTVRRLSSYFLAPLFPLLAVAAIVVLTLPLGLLMRLEAGVFVAGLGWILMLVAGLAMGVLLFGLALGWPLMWPTISSEESGDVFEATQRCYSYTFDRPLSYLLYVLLAALLGALGWVFVLAFSEAVIELGFWAVAWGAGTVRAEQVELAARGVGEARDSASVGTWLIGLNVALVRAVATSYLYAYFWCAASAIYLLLRYDVDQTELDEVHVDEEVERFGLPPLEMDAQGVPMVPEPSEKENKPPSDAAADSSSSSTERSEAGQPNSRSDESEAAVAPDPAERDERSG